MVQTLNVPEASAKRRRFGVNDGCAVPYARTNMETVNTVSTELLILNSVAISGAAGADIADAKGLRKV